MNDLEDTHFWFVGKRLFIQRSLSALPPKRRTILDVGAGTGGTSKFLSHFGSVTGLEKNQQAIRFAKKRGLQTKKGSANALPFRAKTFDLVTFIDVLYHKGIDEKKALKEAYRVLKPGGTLCITDCALPFLWTHHDVVMEAKYRYTKRRLSELVDRAGFTITQCHYIFTSIFPFFILRHLMRSDKITTPPKLINSLLVKVLQLEALFPHWIVRLPGSSILILAHRP